MQTLHMHDVVYSVNLLKPISATPIPTAIVSMTDDAVVIGR